MPKIEKAHNNGHLMFCFETCCMVSTNIPPGGVERIFQKFPREGVILAAANVMGPAHNFGHPRTLSDSLETWHAW